MKTPTNFDLKPAEMPLFFNNLVLKINISKVASINFDTIFALSKQFSIDIKNGRQP